MQTSANSVIMRDFQKVQVLPELVRPSELPAVLKEAFAEQANLLQTVFDYTRLRNSVNGSEMVLVARDGSLPAETGYYEIIRQKLAEDATNISLSYLSKDKVPSLSLRDYVHVSDSVTKTDWPHAIIPRNNSVIGWNPRLIGGHVAALWKPAQEEALNFPFDEAIRH
ncbi:Uncharacterised protein [uncultured archaeon]|nr:Uncharacterised protein [uncultured archaeon]